MDYKNQIRNLKSSFGLYCIKEPNAADIMIDAAQSITDLLSRAEAAEARAEKAERERDEALEAICTHCLDYPCRESDCPWWSGQKEE